MQLGLHIIIDTCQVQALANALVGILQVVLTYQSDVYLACGVALLGQEGVPALHGWCLAHGYTYLTHDGSVESLLLHAHWHLVDAWHILALHHALQVDVAERCHLHSHRVVQMSLCAQHQYVGLYSHTLQLFHAVLSGLGLQLVGCLQIGYISKVYAYRIAPQLPAQLSDGFHKWRTLYVAYGAAHLCYHKVQLLLGLVFAQHAALNLVGDVWHHLDGLSQVVAVALAIYHRLIDATGCY